MSEEYDGGLPPDAGVEGAREGEGTRTGIYRVQPLLRYFYAVARSRELKTQPRRVELWGRAFVLFRDTQGRAAALLDRCPHRNVPLSDGRVTKEGRLECPYHGWQFEGGGQCVAIPGHTSALPQYRAAAFQLREQDGFLWLCPSEQGPVGEPFQLPYLEDRAYTTVIREVAAEASLYAVLENALDVPHTAVLHRGLFRSGQRSRVQVQVSHYEDHIVARYTGEPAPRGLVARVLAMGGGASAEPLTVEHEDRFYLPSLLQVEYRLGRRVHFLVTGLGVPTAAQSTRLFAVISFRTPLPGLLLKWLLEPLARWIFNQDAALLRRQTRNVQRFGGEEFHSTQLDALGPGIWRLLRRAARAAEGREPSHGESGDAHAGPDPGKPLQVDEFEMDA